MNSILVIPYFHLEERDSKLEEYGVTKYTTMYVSESIFYRHKRFFIIAEEFDENKVENLVYKGYYIPTLEKALEKKQECNFYMISSFYVSWKLIDESYIVFNIFDKDFKNSFLISKK